MEEITEEITEEISDAVLYRNLYTNILSQQINAENRLHRLMISRHGQDKTFDEHFDKVRRKVEKDRIRIQKLGERLVMMEKKEMQAASKNRKVTPGNTSVTKDRKPAGIFATLVNMESLRNQFKYANSLKQPNRKMNTPEPVTPNQPNVHQNVIDPKEIEVFFENGFSQKAPNTTLGTPLSTNSVNNKQGNSKKNYAWVASQVDEDDFPKRVSFNDIPDVIAEWEIGNEKLKVIEEDGWNSDISEDEPEVVSVKRYHEPPPPHFNYSYHDGKRRNETSPKTSEQAQKHNQKKAERSIRESPASKYPETRRNDEERWDVVNAQENSPFGSPWEDVISTSLVRQRNDSTQAVPSSTTNNEVFADELSRSKTAENDQPTVEAVLNTCTNINASENGNEKSASRENQLKVEPQEKTTNEEWSPKQNTVQEEMNASTEVYEHVVKNKHDTNFIQDDALTAMRRQSWSTHPPEKNKKQRKTRGKLASVFRRAGKKKQTAKVIKGDKKEFHVAKNVRRRMSLRPLPETPDVVEENTIHGNTADSLDTFH